MDDSASQPRGVGRADAAAAPDPQPPTTRRRVGLGLGLAVLAAVTTWLFGHLPWVLSGFSWPTTEAAPVGSASEGLAGVRLAIPLVSAFLTSLIAFTAIGSVAAALLPLVLTTRASGHRLPAIVVVVVAVALTTTVVTLLARNTIQAHAADAFAGDPRVLRGLVLVVLTVTVAGAVLGTLASLQVGFLPLAAAFAAGQAAVWVGGFVVDHDHGVGAVRTVEQVSNGLVFAILAVAFALSVRRSAGWVLLWPVAVATFWVATPFRVMTGYLAGQLRPSSGLPGSLPDILQGGLDVFRASFWQAPQARWPWVAALLVGLVSLAVERGLRRTRETAQR